MKQHPPLSGAERFLRAAHNKMTDRPPVWIMRQAGRYLPEYRALCERHSFKQRCEVPELAIEISLQPFRRFSPDGVIMFSDILTPLEGMGIPFELVESVGPIIQSPIRTQSQIDDIRLLEPERSLPFIRDILQGLRSAVNCSDKAQNADAAVLGFVGAPWTLATYLVEGKRSQNYATIKEMAYKHPALLHQLLDKMTESISRYACYQIDSGAQVIQIFDSWAGQLSPKDYQIFALPYEQRIVETIQQAYPNTPVVLYINGSAGLLEQIKESKAQVIGIDWTVDIGKARKTLNDTAIQGNLDPMLLLGERCLIEERTLDIICSAGSPGHILNLGHGIYPLTPIENVQVFFETAQSFSY